jgi:hypothetical protein
MTDKPKARRKASFMEVNANPFEQKATTGPKGTGLDAPAEFESLADTVKIERIDFDSIVSTLEGEANNEMRIKTLHIMKTPYLFTSEQLITLLHITPSVKTRITFIEEIGPRLTDPKAQSQQIIEMFRYSEEKRQVEEVLKARAQTVSKQSTFSRGKSASVLSTGSGGRGGRGAGGRGAGGRGAGGRGGMSKAVSMDTMANATVATPVTGGGRGMGGRGAGRGSGGGRGVVGRGAGGRGPSTSISPVTPTKPEVPAPSSTPLPTSPPTIPDPDTKEEIKVEDSKPPVWTPPQPRSSFTSPEKISDLLPRTSFEKKGEVKPIAMHKRFSNRGSIRTANSLGTVDDTVNESDEDVDENEARDTVLVEKEEDGRRSPSPVKELASSRRPKPERRESSFCATGSVMAALGFDDLSVLTTDDIGRESWDIKADIAADVVSKNVPSEEEASKLKYLAENTRAKENLSGTPETDIDDTNSNSSAKNDNKDNGDCDEVDAVGMRSDDDFKNDPMVSQVKPTRVSLQELQERRRVLKVKKVWEKGLGEKPRGPAPIAEFKPLRVTNRRKSTRLIAEEERMIQYASSKEEGPIAVDETTGKNLYSYHELVRRNYVKSYGDVVQTELEEYLTDGEFYVRFNMGKEEFASLPRWRKVERKRALMLF